MKEANNIMSNAVLFRDNMADFAFFIDEARDELMKKLAHLIDYTPLVLAVLGPQGVGKTALLKHRFIYNKKPGWRTCIIDANLCKRPEQLYEKLNADLQLTASPAQSHQQLENIAEQLDSLTHNNINCLLIIDNAENVSKALLPVITGLCIPQPDFPPLLRLILFGQKLPKPLVDAATKESKSADDAINVLALEPFGLEGTRQYIFHCLESTGSDKTAAFNNSLVQEIHEKSGGLIPRINAMANKLLPASGKVAKRRSGYSPLKLVAIALAISITLALLFLKEPNPEKEEIKIASEGQRITQPIDLPDENQQQSEPVFPELRRDEFLNPPPKPAPESNQQQAVTQQQTPSKKEAVTQSGDKSVAAETDTMVVMKEEEIAPVTEQAEVTETEAASATPVITAEPPADEKAPEQSEQGLSATRIRNLPANHYTIQLIASGNEKAVQDYIAQHQLGINATHIHTKRDNKDWYVVVYGTYAGRSEANSAVSTLPPAIRNTKPWIRTLGGLQKTMVP